ncbi:MAG: hypothetical protein JWO11_4477 [Nocardioides sp.]|nr:hypothetical protein [Nocardioides sp.]
MASAGPWGLCLCGHSMLLHDVEDMEGNNPSCCVEGCDQRGCRTPPSDDVEHCERCGERLYSPAETETHNRTVHNFGPVGTVWPEAEPETRRADRG